MIDENLTDFRGRRVEEFDPENGIYDPDDVAYRLRLDYDEYDKGVRLADLLPPLLRDPNAGKLRSLVFGNWSFDSSADCANLISALVGASRVLKSLEHVFLGDITYEEQELSWIKQCDVTPLVSGLPTLKVLRVRGMDSLEFRACRHDGLEELAFETGGLPRSIVESVLASDFPKLKRLEFWLGTDEYGFDGNTEMLNSLFQGSLFPSLSYLGLMNSQIADELAAEIARAPLLARLRTLDLSMGALSDAGAQALLASPHIRSLASLNVDRCYLSDVTIQALRKVIPEVVSGEQQSEEDYDGDRYVAHSE